MAGWHKKQKTMEFVSKRNFEYHIHNVWSNFSRKFFLLLFCIILCGLNCYGQHMKFLNIPLGGDVSLFGQKLIEKGFERISADSGYEGSLTFWGRFSGENAIIATQYTPKSRLVARVEVQYCGDSEWPYKTNTRHDQEKIYEDRKRAITTKYGNPTVVKSTETYYRFTKWDLRDGLIVLSIERMRGNPNKWGMYVIYDDKTTIKKFLSEIDSDF